MGQPKGPGEPGDGPPLSANCLLRLVRTASKTPTLTICIGLTAVTASSELGCRLAGKSTGTVENRTEKLQQNSLSRPTETKKGGTRNDFPRLSHLKGVKG